MAKKIYEIVDEHIKKGRPPKYSNPTQLWNKSMEYFNWKKTQTFPKPVIAGRDAEHRTIDMPTPMTFAEWAMFCGHTPEHMNEMARGLHDFAKEADENGLTFAWVISQVKEAIRQQKIEGASTGVFQHNIIAMEMGLKQIKDIQSGGQSLTAGGIKVTFEDMSEKDE